MNTQQPATTQKAPDLSASMDGGIHLDLCTNGRRVGDFRIYRDDGRVEPYTPEQITEAICRRVNAHDALVEALKEFLNPTLSRAEIHTQARAALAAVKGGAA